MVDCALAVAGRPTGGLLQSNLNDVNATQAEPASSAFNAFRSRTAAGADQPGVDSMVSWNRSGPPVI